MNRRGHRESRDRGGFTLYEVVIVMVLILVMAAVVAPTFSSFFPALKTQKAADGLMATLRKAHDDAALHLRHYRLNLVASPRDGSETPYYYLSFEPDPLRRPGTFRPVPGAWGKPEDLPDDIAFESIEGAADDAATGEKYFEFAPDGTNTKGAITIASSKGDQLIIRTTATTGKVTVEEPAQP